MAELEHWKDATPEIRTDDLKIRDGGGPHYRHIAQAFLGQLRQCLSLAGMEYGYWTKVLPDGTLIEVSHNFGNDSVRITPITRPKEPGELVFDFPGYQFIGSSDYLYRDFEDPLISGRWLPRVYATLTNITSSKTASRPLVSSAEAPPDAEWTYDANPINTDQYLTLTPAHQLDGSGVRYWHGENEFPYLMTQWQQGQPLHALGRYSAGSNIKLIKADMGYDFGPTYFDSPGLVGVNKSPDSDWYQSACIINITHETHGAREFIIMVDVNSVFYAYPTDGYGDTLISSDYYGEKANVPVAITKSQAAPFPAWVTDELKGQSAYNASVPYDDHFGRLRPRWRFNLTGTKAVCVVANRDDPWEDAYFTSEYRNDAGTLQYETQEDYPGLVEVGFTITLTGNNLEDFTFSVALEQSIYSKTDGVIPVDAGYAQTDMGDVLQNSLVMLEYRYYTDVPACAAESNSPNHAAPPTLYDLVKPNLAAVAVVSYQSGASWISARQWLAYYGCYPTGINGSTSDVEPRKFSPVITDFIAVTGGPTYHTNHFTYIAQLVSLEMDTLSFGIVATATTYGVAPKTSGNTYGAEAAKIFVVAFNQQVSEQTIGEPLLSAAVNDLYTLSATYPDIGAMTQIYLNATLDYTYYNPAWITDPNDDDKEIGYATLDVNDGDGNSWSNLIQDPCEDALVYPPIYNSGLFTDYTDIYIPKIFTFFDLWSIVRPGIRWKDSGGWVAGSLSFTGYPYAAVLHGDVSILTLNPLNNVWHRIHTHPNGSYAYWLGPFAAKTEVVDFGAYGGTALDTPNTYEQVISDRIFFGSDSTEGATSSHLTAMNLAFNKTLTYSDFYFKFQQADYFGVDVPHVRPETSDPSANSWYATIDLNPLGSLLTGQSRAAGVLANQYCFEPAFGILPHATENFPTPVMEAVFLPPSGG